MWPRRKEEKSSFFLHWTRSLLNHLEVRIWVIAHWKYFALQEGEEETLIQEAATQTVQKKYIQLLQRGGTEGRTREALVKNTFISPEIGNNLFQIFFSTTFRSLEHFFFKKKCETMGKIQYGKCGGWITPVGVLLSLLSLISAQPGFLSIDCGGKTNRTDYNDITWVTDANYIKVGQTVEIFEDDNDFDSYLHTLRVFPKPLVKSCYQLPVVPDVPYLLRLWFSVGNYTGFKQPRSFAFSIETEHMLAMGNLTIFFKDMPFHNETIFVSSGRVLYICLIRTLETDDPFISAIELRMLQQGMYQQAKPGTMLVTARRCDVGGDFNSFTRYPEDKFDRIWDSKLYTTLSNGTNIGIRMVRTEEPISTNDTKELPPLAVMRTAGVITMPESFLGLTRGPKALLLLYFAEIDNISRSFNVTSGKQFEVVTSLKNDSTSELTFISNPTGDSDFALVNTSDATSDPIINAFETYDIVDTQPATYAQDFKALEAIKSRFRMKDWISDPCFLTPWKEIVCKSNTSPIRISEIDLSGKNLTGLVPNEIGQLTALVKLSLGNNHFMGPLPNFSSLTMLERLYLQNNSLNGTFPFWLSELKNLKELNIGNNNISGVIPAQLRNNLVKFSYCGNPYLQIPKGACILHDTKEKKLKVILETTLTGIPIIALALIVAIVMYRNKFGRKEQGFDHDRTVLEEEPRSFVSGDYSMGRVPNPAAKPRAFTLEELLAATQSFSREIGRGGFGSVFLGELPRGKNIAVKVLSQFSQQGVQEFLNEVDLLSRIHHRNLVCLLGYCKESKEVMLIYEYMSGGSLRDHLYGPNARQSKLNWRMRLKIALDAAQGLEYLHVGCTPRIIHRDIKTANILLDSNLNGKLADFGLSRITNDGEATHVTTAVKGTFGYLDPEYYSTQMLTEKSDVYSFGVVLLEIISGRPPIDPKLPEEEVNIIHWATPYLAEIDENGGTITEIIDEMLGESYDMKSMTCVAKVAKRCVQAGRSCRPSMSEVVAELKEAIKLEDLLAGPVDSIEREGMEWSDDSCNISNVGR